MDFVLTLGVLISVTVMIIVITTLRKLHVLQRKRKLLEKYIGVRTPMGELVSLLNELDMVSQYRMDAPVGAASEMEMRVAELTRNIVFANGYKDQEISRELRNMGYLLVYAPRNRYKYILQHATVTVPMRPPAGQPQANLV